MTKKLVMDHLHRSVEYSYPPKRIVSLAPGVTDTLYSLGLEMEMVGRTRYCIHPKNKVDLAMIVGGTKDIHLDKIRALKPDLIFAEKEENTKEIVELLEKEFPVFVAEVDSVQTAFKMIKDLGEVTNRKLEANHLLRTIQLGFKGLPSFQEKRVAYVIWRKPYMVAGNNTYISSLLTLLGFENAFSMYEGRYPIVTEEDFQHAKLDYLFLATEPFPFKEKHITEMSAFLPEVKTVILDGEMFWYGPRMIEAATYFNKIFE
ncbi:ABC transporter substrate-binding protein [Mesobacillus maritimus]|uniref:ABC transporter substrate-binding protein n=1 Tax=Mesobacillus maritimus TaxID=1643336 RepID=A0ABS7KBF8_9BACI|nr:helical backbone metal receptor [Mesobacillus maritimus]MBY0099604.1 ABC transporter substrate-binding protein [Mesobacillus maritimus]